MQVEQEKLPGDLGLNIMSYLSKPERMKFLLEKETILNPSILTENNTTHNDEGIYDVKENKYQTKSRAKVLKKAEVVNPEIKYLRLHREMYGETETWIARPEEFTKQHNGEIGIRRNRAELRAKHKAIFGNLDFCIF